MRGDSDVGRFKGCPATTTPEIQPGAADVDLVAELPAAPAEAGKPQTVEVTVTNRGRGGGGSQRYSLVLALVDRDLTRQVAESNEANNLDCVPAELGGQAVVRNDLSRLFGSAALIQINEPARWGI